MANPLNPLDWIRSAQDWFTRTERSSGFRPYLIFLLILVGFVVVLLACFPNSPVTTQVVVPVIYTGIGGFVLIFAIKAFQDPDFCRSEKHIENVRKIAMMEQKGDIGPKPIDVKVIANPSAKRLPGTVEGGEQ